MHGVFDVPEYIIVNSLIMAILLGLLMARPPFLPVTPSRNSRWGSLLLLAACLVSALFSGWIYSGYAAYLQGVNAAKQSDWAQAASWMDQAVQRDPTNRFYRFQKALAYGELALNPDGSVRDSAALKTAAADYEAGLAIEPENALHWANLAILRRADGDPAGAVQAMQEAVKRAKNNSVLHFNLGRLYEESGQIDPAVEAYQRALLIEPVWQEDIFHEGSPAWRMAFEGVDQKVTTHAGWQALEKRQYLEAEKVFRARLGVNAADEYRGLGMALFGLGRIQEADHALRTAAFIDGVPLYARLSMAKFYQDVGDMERARSEYSDAGYLIDHYSTFGPGIWDGGRYAWLIYRRVGFDFDLLPGWTPNYHPAVVLP